MAALPAAGLPHQYSPQEALCWSTEGSRLVCASCVNPTLLRVTVHATSGQPSSSFTVNVPWGAGLAWPLPLYVTQGAALICLQIRGGQFGGAPSGILDASVYDQQGTLVAQHSPPGPCFHAICEGLVLAVTADGTLLRVRGITASGAWQQVALPPSAAVQYAAMCISCSDETAAVWRFTASRSSVCLVDLVLGAVAYTFNPASPGSPQHPGMALSRHSVALGVGNAISGAHTVTLWGARQGLYGQRICAVASSPPPPACDPSGRFFAVALFGAGVSILLAVTGAALASWTPVWHAGHALSCRWLEWHADGLGVLCQGESFPPSMHPGVQRDTLMSMLRFA